jgi:hypothetical protein
MDLDFVDTPYLSLRTYFFRLSGYTCRFIFHGVDFSLFIVEVYTVFLAVFGVVDKTLQKHTIFSLASLVSSVLPFADLLYPGSA